MNPNSEFRKSDDEILNYRSAILEKIAPLDVVDLLARTSWRMHFSGESMDPHIVLLRELPILYYLTSAALSLDAYGTSIVEDNELDQLIENVADLYMFQLQGEWIDGNSSRHGMTIPSARMLKILGDMNPEGYLFQYEEYVLNFLATFDDWFLQRLGLTATSAWGFGVKLLEYCEIVADESQNPLEMFSFEPRRLSKRMGISDFGQFTSYLRLLSCRLLDSHPIPDIRAESVLFKHPLIEVVDGRYFVPLLQYPLFNLPQIFEGLVASVKDTDPTSWDRYNRKKSEYVEQRVAEYLCRVFPSNRVFKNLHFEISDKRYEVDVMVVFDNKAIIVEVKSGNLTPPAKRGAPDRLRSDLKKLIGDAHAQGKRAKDFITSSAPVQFLNERGSLLFSLEYRAEENTIYLANVTLEPLSLFSTDLSHLKKLGITDDNEFVWSLGLRDLDIVTRHIVSPSIFLHYLEHRSLVHRIGTIKAFDEISFLGCYISAGNLRLPESDEANTPVQTMLMGWGDEFDRYYLHGGERPELRYQVEIFKIIEFIESQGVYGFTDAIGTILDFNRESHVVIEEQIRRVIKETSTDQRMHDFSLYSEIAEAGITVLGMPTEEGLIDTLRTLCVINKYRNKCRRWIGIAYSLTLPYPHILDWMLSSQEWYYDQALEELLRKWH